MKDLAQLMKTAQEMQARMAEIQGKLGDLEITGSAAGGMVEVTLDGKGKLRGLKLDPSLLDPGEAGVLKDLIIAAHNNAKAKADARVAEEMGALAGGLGLPPGLMPQF